MGAGKGGERGKKSKTTRRSSPREKRRQAGEEVPMGIPGSSDVTLADWMLTFCSAPEGKMTFAARRANLAQLCQAACVTAGRDQRKISQLDSLRARSLGILGNYFVLGWIIPRSAAEPPCALHHHHFASRTDGAGLEGRSRPPQRIEGCWVVAIYVLYCQTADRGPFDLGESLM